MAVLAFSKETAALSSTNGRSDRVSQTKKTPAHFRAGVLGTTLRVPQGTTLRVPQGITLRVPQGITLRVPQGTVIAYGFGLSEMSCAV